MIRLDFALTVLLGHVEILGWSLSSSFPKFGDVERAIFFDVISR